MFLSVFVHDQCDLAGAVHQLIGNHSIHEENEARKGRENYTISVSEFPAVAAGSVLYLASPDLVCTSVRQGTWGEETEHFLHKITHGEHHEHSGSHHDHEYMDVHGTETVLQELQSHYEPVDSEVSTQQNFC